MKTRLGIFISTLLLIIVFCFQTLEMTSVYAETIKFDLKQPQGYGISALGSSGEGIVQLIIKNVLFLFFAVGGIGTIIYFLWGAVDWILSGGDKEKVGNARKKMTHAIIGLILLALSFVIIRTIGGIVGFDPLGNLQIRSLGDPLQFVPNR